MPDFRVHPHLRISDADREAAIARLGEHYAAGRLDKDEFDERSDAVWTAKVGADLAPIFADLEPQGVTGRPPRPWARPEGRPAGGRGWLPVPFVPALLVLIALTAITHIPFVLFLVFGCFLVYGRRRRHWHR